MRNRPTPWRWPVAIALAMAFLFGGVFLVPRAWIDSFFSPLLLLEDAEQDRHRGWLEILPPPELRVAENEPEPPMRPEPPPPTEWNNPDWWRKGWRMRVETGTVRSLRAASVDSVTVLLEALGIGQDFMTRAKPDSLLASRLQLLRLEDSTRFDELKPFLGAMGRAEQYRDIMSRKADIYDDFLAQDIIAPDASGR